MAGTAETFGKAVEPGVSPYDLEAEAQMDASRLRAAIMSVALGLALVLGLWFLSQGDVHLGDGPGTAAAAPREADRLDVFRSPERVQATDMGGLTLPTGPDAGSSAPAVAAPGLGVDRADGLLTFVPPGVEPVEPADSSGAARPLFVIPTPKPLNLEDSQLRTRPAEGTEALDTGAAAPAPSAADTGAAETTPAAPDRAGDEARLRLLAPPRKPSLPGDRAASGGLPTGAVATRSEAPPTLPAPTQTAARDTEPTTDQTLAAIPLPPRRPAAPVQAVEPAVASAADAPLTDIVSVDQLPTLMDLEHSAALAPADSLAVPPLESTDMVTPDVAGEALDPASLPKVTVLPPLERADSLTPPSVTSPSVTSPVIETLDAPPEFSSLYQPTALEGGPEIAPALDSLPPVAVAPTEAADTGPARPKIVIIIDDMGLSRARDDRFIGLPGPLTLSYLPYGEGLPQQTARAAQAGHSLMLHLPMEPLGNNDPGPDALLTSLSEAEIRARTRAALASFDGYVAVNNHMGSRFTTTPEKLRPALREMAVAGVAFVDSKTHPDSVAHTLADALGMRHATRDVFLDHEASHSAIRQQLKRVEEVATATGAAIAIGHPHDATYAELQAWLATLEDRGFQLVGIEQVLSLGTPLATGDDLVASLN